MKRFWIILIVAVVAVAALVHYWRSRSSAQSDGSYQTATVTRGDIQELIPATGTIEPVDSVDIGAQVAGIITSFGPDPKDTSKTVDFRTEVEQGSLLATIDPSLYNADKQQADASLASANANLEVAKANLEQDNVKLEQALKRIGIAPRSWAPGEAL